MSNDDPMTSATAEMFLRRAQAAEAEVERLREVMQRCAEKLCTWGNSEPRVVADLLAREALGDEADTL